jgi:hypothetical protein
MNTTEMLAQLRLNCLLEDSAIDYPDAVLLRELSDGLVAKYQNLVLGMRSAYWQASYLNFTATGVARYRITQQVSVLSKIEIASTDFNGVDNADFSRLQKVDEGHADFYEGAFSGLGRPTAYALRGNDIFLFPTPDSTGYCLKVTFFRRPMRLYTSQNAQAGTDRGRVTAVDNTLRTITVNAIPFDMSLATPSAAASGSRFDIIRPSGWYDPSLGDVQCTIAGNVLSVVSTQLTRNVQVGDYVRVYNQSDWPMLPEEFHRSVVDTATVKILVQRGYQQKASNFAADVSSDLQRFDQMYSKRVLEEPRVIRASLVSLRRGSMRR